jgi:hypothetical protein
MTKKLSIKKLNVRKLTVAELEQVAGGAAAATCSETNYTRRDGTQYCCTGAAPAEPVGDGG